MASEIHLVYGRSELAGGTVAKYRFVKVTSGKIVIAGDEEKSFGVSLHSAVADGEILVGMVGVVSVEASTAITKGQHLAVAANGRAKLAAADKDSPAIALEDIAEDEVGPVLLTLNTGKGLAN